MLTVGYARLVGSAFRAQAASTELFSAWSGATRPSSLGRCCSTAGPAFPSKFARTASPPAPTPLQSYQFSAGSVPKSFKSKLWIRSSPHVLPKSLILSRELSTLAPSIADNGDRAYAQGTDAVPKVEQAKSSETANEQAATRPIVAYHLFFCAALVYLIIVVGGLTRLTESGLSITEWNPGFKGMKLPWTDSEWEAEWEKYKRTPEWTVLNQHMTVDDFKKIYMWEWSHRILGRVIGLAVLLPSIFFLSRGYVAKGSRWKLVAITGGIGFQGFLGWFMVKSGLRAPETTQPAIAQHHANSTVPLGNDTLRLEGFPSSSEGTPSSSSDWHPRVSHFRLAAHLGTAFLVYLGMLHSGISILRDHSATTNTGKLSGWPMSIKGNAQALYSILSNSKVARFRTVARGMTALVFVTAMSGALVAGLDAGLVYSEFPYMGEGIAPPLEELMDPRYALNADAASLPRTIVGNASQNPVTVQFMHRCLATTTWVSSIGLAVYSRRLSAVLRQSGFLFPKAIPRLAILASLTATMQASLGISTLIYLVPIELASAHQAGSVALLTVMTALLACLRRGPTMIRRFASLNPSNTRRQAVVSNVLQRVQSSGA